MPSTMTRSVVGKCLSMTAKDVGEAQLETLNKNGQKKEKSCVFLNVGFPVIHQLLGVISEKTTEGLIIGNRRKTMMIATQQLK